MKYRFNGNFFSHKPCRLITGIGLTSIVVYSSHISSRMNTLYLPLLDAAMRIKLEVTTAHLWLEKVRSKDQNEDISTVWRHLDKVDWYILARLRQVMRQDLLSFRFTHISLIITSLMVTMVIGITFYRFERQRIRNILSINRLDDNLKKEIDERKQLQEILIHREIEFDILFNSIQDVVLFADTHCRIIKNNPAAHDMFGYTDDELIGHTTEMLYADPGDFKKQGQRRYHVGATEQDPYEIRYKRKNGTVFWSETLGSQVKDANGNTIGFIAFLRDITKRKQAEETLLESEERFYKAFQASPDPIIISRTKDGRFIEVNDGFERVTGFSREEVLGKTSTEIGLWKNPDDRLRIIELLQKQGRVRNFKIEFRTKSGEIIICLLSNEPIELQGQSCIVSISRDITDRKKTDEEINRFKTTLDQTLYSVFIFNPKTLKFFYVNQGAMNQVGYAKEELLGMTPLDINPEHTEESFRAMIAPLLKDKKASHTFETVHKHKNGKLIPVEVFLQYVAPPHETGRFVAIVRNIAKRKRAEEEREELNRELIAKNKELGQILHVTSHDLRSPLVNIQGFSKELQHAAQKIQSVLQGDRVPSRIKKELAEPLTEDIPEALTFIFSSISKMDSLLSGLLRISRFERIELTKIQLDMNILIADVLAGIEFQIKKKNITVQIDDLPSTQGDEVQINQLFSNILGNAIKYLDPKRKGIIKISGKKKDNHSIYCTQDNGIGIDRDYQDKIFEIFHRLNPKKGEGEGIGLSIVQKILDRHSGKIWLESEPGKGSKFFVSLPSDEEPNDLNLRVS